MPDPIAVRLVAMDPPGDCYGPDAPVVFGVQKRQDVEQVVAATSTATFELEIDPVRDEGRVDYRGAYVHGRRDERFLYLVWGVRSPADPADPAEPFERFARAKLMLADIPTELVADGATPATLVCTVQATNERGHPASGRIKPPDVRWSAG